MSHTAYYTRSTTTIDIGGTSVDLFINDVENTQRVANSSVSNYVSYILPLEKKDNTKENC